MAFMNKTILHRSKTTMALLAAVSIPVVSATAQLITFNIDGTEGVTTYTQTVGGVQMYLFNPTESSSVFAFGIINSGPSNGDLDLSAPGVLVSAFDFTFDHNVTVTAYSVGVIAGPADGTFDLSGPHPSSTGNTLASLGSHTINNGGFILNVGETGHWTATIPDGTYPTIRSITITEVPEPAEWALATAAFCGVAGLALRRFRARTVA